MAKRSNPVMSYIPGKSVIHALTGTTKLVFFLLFTFSSMLTYDTRVLLGLMSSASAASRSVISNSKTSASFSGSWWFFWP